MAKVFFHLSDLRYRIARRTEFTADPPPRCVDVFAVVASDHAILPWSGRGHFDAIRRQRGSWEGGAFGILGAKCVHRVGSTT